MKESRRKKRGNGEGRITKRGKSWRFEILINGKREGKSVKMEVFNSMQERNDAFAQWKLDLRAATRAQADHSVSVTTVGHLLEKFLEFQFNERLASAPNIAYMVKTHLIPAVGHLDARSPNLLAAVEAYRSKRKTQKTYKGTLTRNATINLEVTYLKQALLMLRPEPRHLDIKKLPTKDGLRRGLVTVEEYQKLLMELEPYQKPVWCFSYYVGRRQSELLRLRREWAKDALNTGIIEVPGWCGPMRITKNGEDSYFALYTDSMREFLRWALETGDQTCPYLFQRNGKRISRQTYYEAFKRTEKRLRMEHIHYHDTRRTAVTNMIEAGIKEDAAMAMSGHLDPSVFRRYRIVTKAKAKANVIKTGELMKVWHEQQEKNLAADYANITPAESQQDGPAARINAVKPN
jgi:integrase